ncbi:cytochrome P450 [Micromonospora sp. NPDC049559]|uniref:cytochrome P450 n=1 Tax=Micromonospora sp. NPDC049559 TaxID=3155923 RepID=UPI003435800D
MTGTAFEELPAAPFLTPPRDPFLPMERADRRRLTAPVTRVRLPNGQPAWLVTGHAEIRQLLRHPGLSADASRPGFPLLRPLPPPRSEADRQGLFIRMDGEEHARLRRMLTAEFMIKSIRRLEPMIQRTVDEALDAMLAAGPPADLVTSFALPVPSMVICHLLGVPYEDHAFFQARSRRLLDQTIPAQEVLAAADELRDYLRTLIDRKRGSAERHDDLLSRLIRERVATGELVANELVGIGLLLLVAGHETTANMIALSTLLLLRHPGHLDRLRAEPELAPGLVEELLRYLTIVRTGLPRLVVTDLELAGRTLRAGDGVIALLPLANRDHAAFVDPDDFDPYREAHQHLAFGFGVHQCIGQPLARAELRVALVELARRLPGLRLAVPGDRVPAREHSVVYGLAELPVTW